MKLTMGSLMGVLLLAFVFVPGMLPRVCAQAMSVPQVISRYRAAVGGDEAVSRITSRVSTGTFKSNSLTAHGSVDLVSAPPNLQMMQLGVVGMGTYRRGFDGAGAWEIYPGS